MGDIYLKLRPEELTMDVLKNMDLSSLNSDDRSLLCSIDGARMVLTTLDMPIRLQNKLNDISNLTYDECVAIINNSTRVSGDIQQKYHNYSINLLSKHFKKFDLSNIERQENINLEFVNSHCNDMDISAFVRIRMKRGDVMDFYENKSVRNKLLRIGGIKWSETKDEMRNSILNFAPNTLDKINPVLDEIFNLTLNKTVFANYYEDGKGSHGVDAIVNFYINNFDPDVTYSWSEFVKTSIDKNRDALIDVFWRDYIQDKIINCLK